MANSRRARGFRTERVVAEYLSTWWTGACVGRGSGKDIVNVPFDCEVKARVGFQPLAYLKQLKARTSVSGEMGFGVLHKEPTDADIDRCTICGTYMIRRCFTCQPTTTNAIDVD